MNKAQRAAINRVITYYRDRNAYNGVTSVRVAHEDFGSFISLSVTTRRSDCETYSPRQVVCEQYAHIHIGKRGGVNVRHARNGLTNNDASHVQKMTRSYRGTR